MDSNAVDAVLGNGLEYTCVPTEIVSHAFPESIGANLTLRSLSVENIHPHDRHMEEAT